MVSDFNFDDIRSFHDAEVDQSLHFLLQDESFQQILQFALTDKSEIEKAKSLLENIHTISDLQLNFMCPLVEEIILKRSTDGQTFSGLENINKNTSYLFISNHRDIILDSALMNYLMVKEGMNATEVAMGSNLLIEKWIELSLKLNRAFVVRRDLCAREMLMSSKKISAYIRRNICELNTSVWIAQREGRTKDGYDKTQPALLKMLNLSNTNEFITGFNELRMVPLSISYEIEPCGISKVAELYKKQTEGYEKTEEDDLKSMGEGLIRSKGRIHFGFGKPISLDVELFTKEKSLSTQIYNLSEYIDQQIYNNYKLWPNNYIAEDILNNSNSNKSHYSSEQYNKFKTILNESLSLISGDSETVRKMFLLMYANPLINYRKNHLELIFDRPSC